MSYEAVSAKDFEIVYMELDENNKTLENYLIKFDASIAATSLDYIELKQLLDELFRHSNLLS